MLIWLLICLIIKNLIQQIAFNQTPDIEFQDFMILYEKCTVKAYSFLVIDTTLTSDNPLLFRKNLLGMIGKLTMAIDDRIRDKKKSNMILTERLQKISIIVK